jgi:hypothetical protein
MYVYKYMYLYHHIGFDEADMLELRGTNKQVYMHIYVYMFMYVGKYIVVFICRCMYICIYVIMLDLTKQILLS